MTARRPRSTPDQAAADVAAAIDRLARRRPQRTDGKLTATNLAAEAGMSRKQLYHYFTERPELATAWRKIATDKPAAASEGEVLRARVRALETELDAWRTMAVIARAEAERQEERNTALAGENERLRAAQQPGLRVVPAP